jgi:hypothetical protein
MSRKNKDHKHQITTNFNRAFQEGRRQMFEELTRKQEQEREKQEEMEKIKSEFPPFYQACDAKHLYNTMHSLPIQQQATAFNEIDHKIKNGFLVQAEGAMFKNDLANAKYWFELALECPDSDARVYFLYFFVD